MHFLSFLFLIPDITAGQANGDVVLYREWVYQGLNEGVWQGIDVAWVYPIAAMVPMVVAATFGHHLYMLGWFVLCAILNFCAVTVLLRSRTLRFGWQAAYLFILLILILGPLVFSRIDGISAPFVVMGLVVAATRPAVASLLLSLATWIKVWPAGVVMALVLSSKARLRVLIAGIGVSAIMVMAVVLGGGARNLLGFIQAQGDRGMQLEAPLTTPGLWQAVLRQGTYIYPNTDIDTMEIRGSLADQMSAILNPLLMISVFGIALLIFVGVRSDANRQDLFMVGGLALVMAMIVFNKVGSPQFMIWPAAVICAAAAFRGREWTIPVVLMVPICGLTTLIYPLLYPQLLASLNPGVAALLTIRNILLLIMFCWSLLKLWKMMGGAKFSSSVGIERSAAEGHPMARPIDSPLPLRSPAQAPD
ncbi:glycosyltransferase 87 family protein [Arthrobacter sp. Cr_A7]|uniref:glycosyltransferase 87 family protein n=1 Tax=Arthrobacter sp. Cr_A7 TaxID=3031017 RepID=UPI0023DBABEA|nr:glycosyltransferase 87 family protein [Arthrobacter sp. Cr_A7]MDF2048350.1 glycosyltransferase 87 family protein [Arthrobacter sp. Cr_A7]